MGADRQLKTADLVQMDNSLTTIYSLLKGDESEKRHAQLSEEHIAPLTEYVNNLRIISGYGKEIPFFDPKDGGIDASILFLLEAPGPKSVASGFISRDNPDPTARNMSHLFSEAGISRKETVSWNIVPWYVGNDGRIRAASPRDIRAGVEALQQLRGLLPNIRVIVLVGKKAQQARAPIETLFNVPVLVCPHPSQRVLNVWPHLREEIKSVFKQAIEVAAKK